MTKVSLSIKTNTEIVVCNAVGQFRNCKLCEGAESSKAKSNYPI